MHMPVYVLSMLSCAVCFFFMVANQDTQAIITLNRAERPLSPVDTRALFKFLGTDIAFVRDAIPINGGKDIATLLIDPVKKRSEIVLISKNGLLGNVGRYAETPREDDDTIGIGAVGLGVDAGGNIWVATNTWGRTSVPVKDSNGQTSKKDVDGVTGAIKKFAPNGRLLGTVTMLQPPIDICMAVADGAQVLLASYRWVTGYQDKTVYEGAVVISTEKAARIAEIKIPGGSIDVDVHGMLWVSDVAGHIACYNVKGQKVRDISGSPREVKDDVQFTVGMQLPVVVRCPDQLDANRYDAFILFAKERKYTSLRCGSDDMRCFSKHDTLTDLELLRWRLYYSVINIDEEEKATW